MQRFRIVFSISTALLFCLAAAAFVLAATPIAPNLPICPTAPPDR